jgi:hypothetical protein
MFDGFCLSGRVEQELLSHRAKCRIVLPHRSFGRGINLDSTQRFSKRKLDYMTAANSFSNQSFWAFE